jgi:CRP-like cAMP-binding protein
MFDVKNWFLLNNLSESDKTEIIKSFGAPKDYKKGGVIYSPDSFSKAIGLILSGRAEATGENVLKRVFSEGDTFGAAALFGDEKQYISSIKAKTDCTVLFVDEKLLISIFNTYPSVSLNYISFLSDRVRLLNRKIGLYTCKGAGSKLYEYLTLNADENNRVTVTNMSSLAKAASLGRTSLYRAFDELESRGMVKRDRNVITII